MKQESFVIKHTDSKIKEYYKEIKELYDQGQTKESAVAPKFYNLLDYCSKKVGWLLSAQYTIRRINKTPDGAFLDKYSIAQGFWEAKDDFDSLENEIKSKFAIGYPRFNTIFWQPRRIVIYQNNVKVYDEIIENNKNETLAQALNIFFMYEPPHYEQWLEAVLEFEKRVPELAQGLLEKIEWAKNNNPTFINTYKDFKLSCTESINPNISDVAIEEMIIQHLLTERLLKKVFDLDNFVQNNAIAGQLDVVINALTSAHFNRAEFLGKLDFIYKSIEAVADDIDDFKEKQTFINTVYEKFFQGWAIKSADTLGIVYTPQPVVDFMVRSVEELLKSEFDKSLSSPNVHIIDPFVGTGNFILRVIRELDPTELDNKYKEELHCNEIALMPYYIASINIEHEYNNIMKRYKPFTGICFADTFQTFEDLHYL